MKKITTLALLLALTATGCGNDTMLSGFSSDALGGDGNGSGDGEHNDDDVIPCAGDEAAMAEAAADLADNLCAECNPATGTAEHLFAEINPQEYTGGPLEVGLVIGNPAGIAGSSTRFKINGVEFEIPAEAWKLSEDGTVGRVVLVREAGLPQGAYHVGLSIYAAVTPAFNEEQPNDNPDQGDAGATWLVECPDEPGQEPEHPDEPANTPAGE